MGEVWLADHLSLRTQVVVKFLGPLVAQDPANLARFQREAAAAAQVRSPHVVQTFDFGVSPEGVAYIVMELLEGRDLSQVLRDRTLSLVEAAHLVEGVARALTKAHERGIVHRDIKPANVLIGADGKARLADLGIGAVAAPTGSAVQTTALRGACTPLYASAQQLRGEEAHPRDDVFALGVVWYQLLTGQLGDRPQTDWREELHGKGLDEAGMEVLGRCLAVRPERRWADAGAVLRELEKLREGMCDDPEEEELGDDPLDAAARLQRRLARAQENIARARVLAEQRHDYLGAVRVLERLPGALRDEAMVEGLRERHGRRQELRARIRKESKLLKFEGLHDRLAEYLALAPDDEEMRRLLDVVPYRPGREAVNECGMSFVLVPAGEFVMGSAEGEAGRHHDEGPTRRVVMENAYYLGIHQVTQGQYQAVMGSNPSLFRAVAGEDARAFPVEHVSWEDAVEFCRRLSEMPGERRRKRKYRLPTEAEWEHACRAGSRDPFAFGGSLGSGDANCDGRHPYGSRLKGTFLRRPSVVGSYKANAWGLFDMHGNVWEWCQDWYDGGPRRAVGGPKTGTMKVMRGGSWQNHARLCRSASRESMTPTYRGPASGLRVVLEVGWGATSPAGSPGRASAANPGGHSPGGRSRRTARTGPPAAQRGVCASSGTSR